MLYLNLALEGDAEHPDARRGRVTIKIRTFNETITIPIKIGKTA